ncbi:MAG: hypothetical protein KAY37_04845 [Phycisphaerae bacterium]|nr:hypothetical protein [Phycisphaerae bacterium]
MKYVLLQIGVLTAVVALAVAIGHGPVVQRWGPAALTSLYAAAAICLAMALLAAVPLGLTATYWHEYTPQVAFAGTGVRLLGTLAAGFAYQTFGSPERASFLACLLGIYLLLLLAETGLIVYIISRVNVRRAPDAE